MVNRFDYDVYYNETLPGYEVISIECDDGAMVAYGDYDNLKLNSEQLERDKVALMAEIQELKRDSSSVRGLLGKIKDDLLMRSELDSNGVSVVDMSHTLWEKLKYEAGNNI